MVVVVVVFKAKMKRNAAVLGGGVPKKGHLHFRPLGSFKYHLSVPDGEFCVGRVVFGIATFGKLCFAFLCMGVGGGGLSHAIQ